ncbi:MAG: hypothetical protein IH933_16405 [Euryarchaeota archaeon]|nr:hypothetical protein [Euryarchaeota archaeon]
MTDVPRSVRKQLESLPHVVGTAIGKKRVEGRKTDETCIVVFVDEKLPDAQLTDKEIIPETVECDGETLATDVQQVGEVTALEVQPSQESERTERLRPAPGGVSIGHPEITAGTMGSTLLENEDGESVVLTNAHVAAPEVANEGDPIYQPGPEDGGEEGDEIGELREWSEISSEEPNTSDSALVSVDPDDIDEEILGIGPLVDFSEPDIESDDEYVKSGRTTGVETGELRGRDTRIEVGGFGPEPVIFEGVDTFTSMGDPGDSGSLIGIGDGELTATNLLFAGSDDATIAIPTSSLFEEHGELIVENGDGPDNGDDPDEPGGDFEDRLRDRLEDEYDEVSEEESAFRVSAWPLDLLVIPGEDLDGAAARARESNSDAVVIAVPAGMETEIPDVPAGVAVVNVDL